MDFEQLYNTYYMQIYSFVMTLARDSDCAEEITQKTFFKALSTDKKYRGDASEFTWLCAIAKNLFNDELKRQARHSGSESESVSDVSIETAFEDEESTFRIHQALHNLEEPYKEVFQLRVFGELSFQKIGLLFSKTENWARVTYHRARLKIQERMDIK
ncbi:MAG: RNA polymerase sigma factor [Oscillospiraceae bacterium]|nr:RNA polymerase sigma factor [Oscillospiraceae bacterium]